MRVGLCDHTNSLYAYIVDYLGEYFIGIGLTVTVVTPVTTYRSVSYQRKVIRTPFAGTRGSYRGAVAEITYALQAAWYLRRRAATYDVIHTRSHIVAALLAATMCPVPIVLNFGMAVPALKPRRGLLGATYPMPVPLRWASLSLRRFAALRATALVANSIVLRDRLAEFWGIPRAAFDVMPDMLVPSNLFAPRARDRGWMAKLGITDENIVVLCVARLASYKNQLMLVDLARTIVAEDGLVKFMLWGPVTNADYARKVRARIREFDLDGNFIMFHEEIAREELPMIYSLADVYVQPSTEEGGPPATLVEAMLCGLPIVASSIPQHLEVSPDHDALWFADVENLSAWLKAVRVLLRDSGVRNSLGASARSKAVENLSAEVLAQRTLQIYERSVLRYGGPDRPLM